MTTENKSSSAAPEWKAPPIGSPCWIEIPARGDVQELKEFYSKLFPSWKWRAQKPDEDVVHYHFEGGGLENRLDGGIVPMPKDCQGPLPQTMGSGMTVYYLVEDIDATKAKVHELGGTTCLEKEPEGGHAFIMNFRDPHGNRFGCYMWVGEHA